MKNSWWVIILAICMNGCSSVQEYKPSQQAAPIAQGEESTFYVPTKSFKAVGADPMATVYTYSKSDIIASIFFEFDKSSPKREYLRRVESAYRFFTQHPELSVLVVGHCDHFGKREYNNKLGLKRAENIKSRLVKLGLAEDRVIVASVGSERAKETSADKNATMPDRRVDIVSFEDEQ